jgi:hypothetical protein
MADPNREDEYLLPLPGAGVVWKFGPEENESFFLNKDHSSATTNVAKLVWANAAIVEATCFIHTGPIWLSKSEHRAYFNNLDNIEEFQADLNTYKQTPFVHMVNAMHKSMCCKWAASEPLLAEKWESLWGGKRIIMVEANEDCPLCGGKPSDNNTLESMNGKDKSFQNWEHVASLPMASQLVSHVQHHPLTDLVFNGKLKSNSCEAGNVHFSTFYASIHLNIIYHDNEQKASCLGPTFTFSNTSN